MSGLGNLYLIPVPISSDVAVNAVLPAYNLVLVKQLKKFIAENAKEARKHLKIMGYGHLPDAEILELNEHSRHGELTAFLNQLKSGENIGLMSDAGCPGIADPGAEIVRLAHSIGVRVIPLVGPSSIVMSIMASGFTGQNFAFVGYLPIEKAQKTKRLKELETLALKHHQAQFFIETPYRNNSLLELLLEQLSPQTTLFIGKHISGMDEALNTRSVDEWRKLPKPNLHKVPVVFGIYS